MPTPVPSEPHRHQSVGVASLRTSAIVPASSGGSATLCFSPMTLCLRPSSLATTLTVF